MSFEEEMYPPRFLELAGLNLPPTNTEQQGGCDICPGSNNKDDMEDDKEDKQDKDCIDPEHEFAHLQQLAVQEDTPAPAPAPAPTPSSTDAPTDNDHQLSGGSLQTFMEIKGAFHMHAVEFLQPGCTIGMGQLVQAKDMTAVQLTLPEVRSK